jgi:hypothetical protein
MGCRCMKKIINEEENEIKSSPKEVKSIINTNENIKLQKDIKDQSIPLNIDKTYEKSDDDSYIKGDRISNTNINNSNDDEKSIEYNNKLFNLINQIRENPILYANKIENSKKNILIKRDIMRDEKTGLEIEKTKIIYKEKLKVALCRGEPAFSEAIEILRNTNPLSPLKMNPNIIIPLPELESQTKDSSYLKNLVSEMRKKINIDIYYKDLIKDPNISALLMIVDDNFKNAGKKRDAVLNSEYKYIGISSKFYKKSFVAFLAFSK